MSNPFVLVDGSSYFFRAFHALPPLTNSKGQATGAIYGVANMIKRLIKTYQPQQFAVVFDAKGKNFRHDLYPAYKANRPPMPVELQSQFEPLLALLRSQGYPLIIIPGIEADDVIGTLAKQASEQGLSVLISTGDKDMAQLVNPQVTLINTMSNQLLDEPGVLAKFGVAPHQMIDYLALVGDTSDNVPGVSKCGPKTAVKWLAGYQTVENLMTHAHEIGGKIGDYLREGLDQLALSKQLVTINTAVELPVTLDELVLQPVNRDELISLVTEFEFKFWLNELLSLEPSQPTTPQDNSFEFELITTESAFNRLLSQLQTCSLMCIDTETTSLNSLEAQLVGLSFTLDEKHPVYIPLAHDEDSPQLNRDMVLTKLKPILEDIRIAKLGQNLKYDYGVLSNYGIRMQGIRFDTMLESYLLNSNQGRNNLDAMAQDYLGYQTIQFKDIAGTGVKQLRFNQIPIEKAAPYAAEDALITWKLHQTLYPRLSNALQTVLHDIEIPLIPILSHMERHGVLIDEQQLATQGARLKQRVVELEHTAHQLAGRAFNLSSPKQLQDILYVEQNIPIVSKTPKGQPSTAEAVLQILAKNYPLPAVILEHRSLSKLLSTYIEALPKRVDSRTGRVHTSYNQAVTATGRLSSSDPNLQNIPIRTDEGRLIRKAFIAPPMHRLVTADYSQIELRIMADLSQDKGLLDAFSKGWDIHAATASELFSVPLDEVSQDQRRRAKAVNFGLIYGMSAFGLANQLSIDRKEAQSYIDRYFQRYPGVLAYMDNTREQAHQQGFVETLFGRRLYLPDINASNKIRRNAAERAAINAPMQGTAADIIKKSMIALHDWLQQHPDVRASMIMQVHDELVFEVHQDDWSAFKPVLRYLMEETVTLSVPLLVSIGEGSNWDEAH